MLFLETVHVKLYSRSRPAHSTCEDGLPYGAWALWVSRVEGVQRFLTSKTSLVYPQGIKGTIFSLSALDYAKRYYACT